MPWQILVVDDDSAVRGLIASMLRRRGAESIEVADAGSALARIRAERFDLLITNIEMPGRTGLWLLEEAKAHRPDLPVLVVTGGVPEDAETSPLHLADAVVLKPFRLNDLYDRVRSALEAREPDGRSRA